MISRRVALISNSPVRSTSPVPMPLVPHTPSLSLGGAVVPSAPAYQDYHTADCGNKKRAMKHTNKEHVCFALYR